MNHSGVKIMTINCRGLADKKKRSDVLNYLSEKHCMIYCLQDCHFDESFKRHLDKEWNGEYYCSYFDSKSRGVTVLFDKQFDHTIHEVKIDTKGNFLVIDLSFNETRFTLCSLYGPNKDSPDFYHNIKKIITDFGNTNYIICGDWNLVINPDLDTQNYVHVNNPKARKVVLDLIDDLNLVDPWRCYNPNVKRFTWRQTNPIKQSRLDFFLISEELLNFVENSDISSGYRSDHSIVSVCLNINEIERGRGYWKFNNSLLKDIEYVNLVKSTIEKVIKQYAVTPYNLENIMTIHPSDLNFVINDQLFFDMLLLEIRGKTISYSSFKKKENNRKEKDLIVEIENLERQHTNLDDHTMEIIANKKNELEVLRSKKIDGAMLRSRVKWLDAGEKPSSFFLNLEKRNCVNKKINRVVGADGLNKCTSSGIQNECFHFYEKLYSEKNLQPVHLQNFMISDNFAKLNENQKQDLEGPIQYEELILALKKMQNNKSPGLDGYTVEFF